MHLNVPPWVYDVLATIGGFGFLYREVFKPMTSSMIDRWQQRHDEPVWGIIMVPKYKPHHTQNNLVSYTSEEIPYSMEEMITRVGRSSSSLVKSLHRLEKRGKVKEVHGGWQRKEK